MLYVMLIIIAIFHGEDGEHLKVMRAPSMEVCQSARTELLNEAVKEGAMQIAVECVPITMKQIT